MSTMRVKNKDGTWDKVPVLGSYQAVLAANEAATNAQNAANAAEAVAPEYAKTKEVLDNIISYTNTATEQASIATAMADTATQKAEAASGSATSAAQSYANSDAVATQLTEYLATKETLTAPAVDKTLLIEGAAADSKVVGELKSDIEGFSVSKNLVNPSTMELGKFIWYADGSLGDSTLYNTTDFIPIKANEPIAFSPRIRKLLMYDNTKNAIASSLIDSTLENYVYTPNVNGYVRVTFYSKDANVQAEYNSKVTSYCPYGRYELKNIHSINNEQIYKNNLKGKTVYNFGDSLMYGHYEKGILDDLCADNGMALTKYAVNGATVLGSTGLYNIENQVLNASDTVPDFVIFDGLMNDDSLTPNYTTQLGTLSDSFVESDLDTNTFYGAMEHLIYTIRNKYMTSNIIFVCCHKTPSRDNVAQDTLQKAVRECCEKWSIPYVDIYNKGQINCYIDSMRNTYSYNNQGESSGGNGTHLTGEGYNKWYSPLIKAKMLELLD